MASVLHGSARTTPCIRAELQASQESSRTLAARYGLNPKTVDKWRKRTSIIDAPMGPKTPQSTVLTPAEEAIVVAFRQKTLLPLDDVLGCLRDTIPNFSRSALHRCLQRHGHLSTAGRGDQGTAQAVQDLRDRLRRHRQLRVASCRRQDRHVPGDRPGLEVRLCRVPRLRWHDGRRGLPSTCGRGLSLQDPYRAYRQRHGLRRPAEKTVTAPPVDTSARTSYRICIERRPISAGRRSTKASPRLRCGG